MNEAHRRPGDLEEGVLGVSYDQMRPEVREYANNIQQQIAAIFRRCNVTSYTEFRERSLRGPSFIPHAAVERLNALLRQLQLLTRKNELPGVIRATNDQGNEVIFDLSQTIEHSKNFFRSHHLEALCAHLPEPVNLSDADEARIRRALQQNFDRSFVLPRFDQLEHSRSTLIERCCNDPMGEARWIQQYRYPNIEDLPRSAKSVNRPVGRPYILLYQSSSVPVWTKGCTFPMLRRNFFRNGWNGLTVDEYIILQRSECEQNNGDHQFDRFSDEPTRSNWSWLLDTDIGTEQQCVDASSVKTEDQGYFVQIRTGYDSHHYSTLGARPTVVIPLEMGS